MKPMPALFISHGAPTLALGPSAAHDFLQGLGSLVERPRAILVVSAHWESPQPLVSTAPNPATIHDFYGFPKALYQVQYPAPGAPDLAHDVVALLCAANFTPQIHPTRGLDHGAWVPLMLAYPQADIHVTQLSVQTHLGPAHALQLGRALAPLTQQGVLIMGSGSATHNLEELYRGAEPMAPPSWVTEFEEWLTAKLLAQDTTALLNYREQAPYAQRNHPTEEHLLPLFVALGASTGKTQILHSSYSYGVLSMAVYYFGTEALPDLDRK